MISKVILKIYSGTVPHVMRQYAWYTSHNLEASHSLHTSEMVKSGIDEYNTSYDETVEGSEEIIFTHPLASHLLRQDALSANTKMHQYKHKLQAHYVCIRGWHR